MNGRRTRFVVSLTFVLMLACLLVLQGLFTHGLQLQSPAEPVGRSISSGSLETADSNYPPVPIMSTFTAVMESNTTTWDTAGIDSPFVLYDSVEGLYKMWFVATSELTKIGLYWACRRVISYAESNDGLAWFNKQVVHDNGGPTPNFYDTGDPFVLKENGTYRMWHFDRWEWVAGDWSRYIARMSSSDGVNWPAFMSPGDQNVMSALGQYNPQGDGNSVCSPSIIYEPDAGYVMWYAVYDHYGPGTYGPCKIWRATSGDGITWTNRQLSLPYVPDSWEANIFHPSVVREDGGTYTMFYGASSTDGSSSIGVATSLDGISWTNRTQLIKPSNLNTNVTWIAEPSYFQDVSGKRYLYFTYYDGTYKFGRLQLQTNPDSWPMFHHDLTHTGYSTSTAPTTNQTIWNYTIGGLVESSPTVADGFVYVGSYELPGGYGKVYALDAATGAFAWSYTAASVWGSPAVAGGVVFVGEADGKVYALNASTGALIWNYTTGSCVWSSPAVADGFVYVGSNDWKVYALNATTGAQIWGYTAGGTVFSSPAVAGGMVFVGSWDHKVYALNAATGAFVWSYTTGYEIWSSPAVADGVVYVGSDDSNTYALNASTGALIWNYTTSGAVDSCPAIAGGFVYVCSCDGKVYALNATTGAQIWGYTAGGTVFSSPAVAGGMVFVGSWDHKVYALNAATGAFVWSYATGGAVFSSPAVAGGVVYVGSEDGKVYAFGVHDVAITNVVSSKDGCLPMPTVGRSFNATINVTVANEGGYTETFKVTAYANANVTGSESVILPSGNSTTVTFIWNTTDFDYGNYTISAHTEPVPGETNTANNDFTGGVATVTIPGDINGDFKVNIFDAILLSNAFNSRPGSPNWKSNADINGDDIVNIFDAIILSNHYNQHHP